MPSFTPFQSYNSSQAILSSGRIIFNSKEDSIFIISKKDVAISTGEDMHINVGSLSSSDKRLIVNSKRTEFNTGTNTQLESVAKGDSLVEALNELISELNDFMSSLKTAKGLVSGGVANLTSVNLAADAFSKKVKDTQKKLDKIKSTILFTQ